MFDKKRNKFFAKEKNKLTTEKVSQRFLLKLRKKRIKKIYSVSVVVLFLGAVVAMFAHNFFDIRGVKIGRENAHFSLVSNSQIEKIFYERCDKVTMRVLAQKNIFLFNSKKLEEEIKQLLGLENIKVSKKIDFKIAIDVVERKPVVNWLFENKYYYIDLDGELIRPLLEGEELDNNIVKIFFSVAGQEEAKIIDPESVDQGEVSEVVEEKDFNLILKNQTDSQIKEGVDKLNQEVSSFDYLLTKIDNNRLNFVLSVREAMSSVLPGVRINAFEFLDPQVSDVRVHTDKDYVIYFDQQIELERQINNLKLILEQKLKNKNIKYIDLRYSDRIYYQE